MTPSRSGTHESPAPHPPAPQPQPAALPPERLASLDAFRGAIMLLMASSGLGIPQVAKQFPNHPVWQFLGRQCEHAPWAGCTLWDLIQPAFMFMVGVALPWSLANRRARGTRFGAMLGHALWRALLLVLLGVFLTSAWSRRTEWVFTNVLAQIGLGYPLLFLLAFAKPRTQWIAPLTLLALYWLAFALHPLPPPNFDWSAVGVPENWPHLTGFAAHWEKNANFAATVDTWLLNRFPRPTPFAFNSGGYQTLNFVPSLATMAFGLIAGRLLRSDRTMNEKLTRLALAGLAGLAIATTLDGLGLCPIVKRIWTPTWTLFAGGWVTLLLAAFVALVDALGCKRWAWPLVVAGLNPMTLYCLWQLTPGFIRSSLQIHLGPGVFERFGPAYTPIVASASVLLVLWLILLWMYRRKLFLRI